MQLCIIIYCIADSQEDLITQLNQKLETLDIDKQQNEPGNLTVILTNSHNVRIAADDWSKGVDKQLILYVLYYPTTYYQL